MNPADQLKQSPKGLHVSDELVSSVSSPMRYGCAVSREERSRLLKHFDFLQVQDTFFQPIQSKTLKRWQEQSGKQNKTGRAIEYAVMAPMTITHPLSDPLQPRCQFSRNSEYKGGHFELNDDSRQAIDNIIDAAHTLGAPWIVFKSPTSFRPTQQNRDLFQAFFEYVEQHRSSKTIDRSDQQTEDRIHLVWQPSGLWTPELSHALANRANVLCAMPDWTRVPLGESSLYLNIETIAFPERELINFLPKIPKQTITRIVFSGKNKVRQARKFALIRELLDNL